VLLLVCLYLWLHYTVGLTASACDVSRKYFNRHSTVLFHAIWRCRWRHFLSPCVTSLSACADSATVWECRVGRSVGRYEEQWGGHAGRDAWAARRRITDCNMSRGLCYSDWRATPIAVIPHHATHIFTFTLHIRGVTLRIAWHVSSRDRYVSICVSTITRDINDWCLHYHRRLVG